MSESISLSELVAARVGMSKPEHYIHREDRTYRKFHIIGQDTYCSTDNSCDARGIVATVKAAPALIEIAQAALAWKRAADDDDAGLVEFDRACEALSTALAKVQP